MNYIDDTLYKKIIKKIPILCIDLIIIYEKQFLLVKRSQNPLINEWWVPGGRVKQGESLDNAATRKLNQELSIFEYSGLKKYGIYQDFFDESSIGSHLYHTVSIVYKLNINSISTIEIDKTSKEWKLLDRLPSRLINKMEIINE
tara:strand:- start:263 stop:694 length:432 start_codon:yes stop_codon:yes gene_type:complete